MDENNCGKGQQQKSLSTTFFSSSLMLHLLTLPSLFFHLSLPFLTSSPSLFFPLHPPSSSSFSFLSFLSSYHLFLHPPPPLPVSFRLCVPCHSLLCPRLRHMVLSSLLLLSINTVVAGNYRYTAQQGTERCEVS